MQLYIAEIRDNNDPNKKGKVQIYCAPIHHDIKTKLLPWAQSASSFTQKIPNIGEYWWVFFEKEEFYQNPFYLSSVQFSANNTANQTISSNLTSEYPNIEYWKTSGGTAIALTKGDKPEISIKHPKAEIYIDTDGHAKLYFSDNKNKMDITSAGIKITDKNNNTIEMGSASVQINGTALEVLL
jgi:hypothetical protein